MKKAILTRAVGSILSRRPGPDKPDLIPETLVPKERAYRA
jgi:hypothetical protein